MCGCLFPLEKWSSHANFVVAEYQRCVKACMCAIKRSSRSWSQAALFLQYYASTGPSSLLCWAQAFAESADSTLLASSMSDHSAVSLFNLHFELVAHSEALDLPQVLAQFLSDRCAGPTTPLYNFPRPSLLASPAPCLHQRTHHLPRHLLLAPGSASHPLSAASSAERPRPGWHPHPALHQRACMPPLASEPQSCRSSALRASGGASCTDRSCLSFTQGPHHSGRCLNGEHCSSQAERAGQLRKSDHEL